MCVGFRDRFIVAVLPEPKHFDHLWRAMRDVRDAKDASGVGIDRRAIEVEMAAMA